MDDAMFNDLARSLEQAAAHARGETVPGLHVLSQPCPTPGTIISAKSCPPSLSLSASARVST